MLTEKNIHFSVVIPLYNKENVISRTIQSVLDQTYSEFELVVVNDGSKDNSVSIVKNFNDPRIRIINQKNGGVSAARNRGIKEAHNDWIFFLDADDVMLPNALSVFEKMINRYPKEQYFSANSLWEGHERHNNVKSSAVNKTVFPFLYIWLRIVDPAPRNIVVHRNLINKFGLYDKRMSFYEDWDFSLRMCRGGAIVYSNQYVAKYLPSPQGLSQTSHPYQNEMAYYFPEKASNMCFWEKALWYENIEQVMFSWQNNQQVTKLYNGYKLKYFSRLFVYLHWIHQQLMRHNII